MTPPLRQCVNVPPDGDPTKFQVVLAFVDERLFSVRRGYPKGNGSWFEDRQNAVREGGNMPTEQPIVVGVDGSEAGTRALRWALQEARRWSSPVHVIAAWESHAVLGGPAPVLRQPERAPHRLHEEYRQKLIRTVRACTADLPSPPDLHVELVEGNAAEVLVQHSAHAAMLVLGDHGRGRASEAMLGRTALRCIHKARCPVLIIPAGMVSDTAEEQQRPQPAASSSREKTRSR